MKRRLILLQEKYYTKISFKEIIIKEVKDIYDLVVIGGGPSGYATAIYSTRAGLKTIVIEKGAPGGKLINISVVHNYPGAPDVKGKDLAINLFEQANSLGAEFASSEVISLEKKENIFITKTRSKTFQSKSVVISTGLINRKVGIPGEDEYYQKGLSYCVVCDGPLVKGKDIALIGGGNSSVQESSYGATLANKLYILQNIDKLTAEQAVIDEMNKRSNIEVILNVNVKEVLGDGKKVTGLVYEDSNGSEKKLDVQGIFPYVGFIPNTSFINIDGVTDENGYVITDNDMKTSVEGLFAAGDVRSKNVRQITTATGDGTIAAIKAGDYIGSKF